MDVHAASSAALNGHLEVLLYLMEEVVCPYDHDLTLLAAMHGGHVRILRWFQDDLFESSSRGSRSSTSS